MKATRDEAPSKSRPAKNYSALLQRDIHTMSIAETEAAPLALHHPGLFELWDQHMFAIAPDHHPLHGHPKARGLQLPTTVGTLELAQMRGKLMRHPKIYDAAREMMIPVPLLGDLLLFLMDDIGPYCLDWDLKRADGDHGKPLLSGKKRIAAKADLARAAFKDELRAEYMAELGIRIVRISLSTFDLTLRKNLVRLLAIHASECTLHPELQLEIVESFRESLPEVQPPFVVIARYVKRGVPSHQVVEVLDQAIWYHRLEVDLFQEVRPDLPLYPRDRNPFDVYAHCFAR